MIDINEERLIRLRDLPEFLPRRGSSKVHIATIYRWAQKGIIATSGERITLETTRSGGSVLTSHEALERFNSRISNSAKSELRVSSRMDKSARRKMTKLGRKAILGRDA